MARHSTNDTELMRKMTSIILIGKISPPGRCHKAGVLGDRYFEIVLHILTILGKVGITACQILVRDLWRN